MWVAGRYVRRSCNVKENPQILLNCANLSPVCLLDSTSFVGCCACPACCWLLHPLQLLHFRLLLLSRTSFLVDLSIWPNSKKSIRKEIFAFLLCRLCAAFYTQRHCSWWWLHNIRMRRGMPNSIEVTFRLHNVVDWWWSSWPWNRSCRCQIFAESAHTKLSY